MNFAINSSRHLTLSILVILLLIPLPAASEPGNEKMTIVIANGEWPPFISEHQKHYGAVCRIISAAFALENVQVIYKWVPWKRAFIQTREGEYDATAGWMMTPKRKQIFYYSDTIMKSRKVFFHLKSNPFDWNEIKDLKNFRIGTVLEHAYGPEFDRAVENKIITVEKTTAEIHNFRKLLAGRLDIFPQELEIGYEQIRLEFPPEKAKLFTHHPEPLPSATNHLIFSKKNKKNIILVERFDRGLKKLKENGKFDEYMDAVQHGNYLK